MDEVPQCMHFEFELGREVLNGWWSWDLHCGRVNFDKNDPGLDKRKREAGRASQAALYP